ncbi:MAG: heavy metal translocating P-type ATPase [Treponema sp.]|nr:heavy metal translocating P-type ATPase [Treponema sp.]
MSEEIEELKEHNHEEHCECHEHHEEHDNHNHDEHEHHHHHDDGCNCGHSHGHSHSHGDDDEEEEEISVKTIIFAAVFLVLGIAFEHLPLAQWIPALAEIDLNRFLRYDLIETLSIVFSGIAFFLCGKDVIIGAIKNIIHGEFLDEAFLMTVASIGAICLKQFPEAAAIMVLYQVGEKFEDYAVDKSRDSIEAISKLRPEVAVVKNGDELTEVAPDKVAIGSVIVVKPGDRIPIDGTILVGESFVDTSALTGESVPRKVTAGDEVLGGSINKQGVLEIKTTKAAGDSALSRILELVENATENKTKSEQFVTRFARVYTPIVVAAAVLLAVVPSVVLGFMNGDWSWAANWSVWVNRALMFLVVSCPCAIVISIPLSFCGGITACAREGILIKGSTFLEALAHTKTAVFDKTGTLTKGDFVVTHIHAVSPAITEDELLAIATHTEMYSTHPISASLKAAHHDDCCEKVKLENVEEITSKGIKAVVDGKTVLAGNTKLMEQFEIKYDECTEHQDGTIIHVACDGIYAGHIVIADEIKDDAKEAVEGLKKSGVENIVMLTGDNQRTADAVASKLGVDKVYGQLLSADKLSKVEELLGNLNKGGKKKGTLIFTGDGINDAPVLARADAGIAMGGVGSDAAVEAADIILMEDNPSKLVEGIRLSRKTVRIVYENLIGSLGIKALILILSAFGIANMWIAVFGDVGVTILAVMNAIRLIIKKR